MPIAQGNRLADETAKRAALGPQILTVSCGSASNKKDSILAYNDVDLDIIQNLGADYDEAHDK